MIKLSFIEARASYRKGETIYINKTKESMCAYTYRDKWGLMATPYLSGHAFILEGRRIRKKLGVNKLCYYKSLT